VKGRIDQEPAHSLRGAKDMDVTLIFDEDTLKTISVIIIASYWLDIGSHSPSSSTSAEPSTAFIYESGEKATDERRRFGCLAIVHVRRFDGSAV